MSKKAPSPLIITRSAPIPISQKLPYPPICSKSAPASYSDFFIGSPQSGLNFEQSRKCSMLLQSLSSEDNFVDDEPKDPVSVLSGELVIEREDS